MKKNIPICLTLTFLMLLSCTKSKLSTLPVSAITVVNAASNTTGLVPLFGTGPIEWYTNAQTIPYMSSYEYSISSGNIPVSVSDISDTSDLLFNGSFSLNQKQIYSLYFVDPAPGSHNILDTLFTNDSIPVYNDSVVGIRFVNLIQDGSVLSVDTGNMPGSQVQYLSYKGYSQFKAYPANSQISGYTFEIRSASTDSLYTTFTYTNMAVFKNITIVCVGDLSNQNPKPVSSFLVNNY